MQYNIWNIFINIQLVDFIIEILNFSLQNISSFRKTRTILELERFKATEFRLFLLYVGKDFYHKFLLLKIQISWHRFSI